jgi:hypothetical protein
LELILGSAGDIQSALKNVVEAAMQGSANVTIAQEKLMTVTTNIAHSRLKSINFLAEDTERSLNRLLYAIVC